MKKFILILWCLIAFVPKEAFSPELVEALKQIYFQKHPGQTKAFISINETKSGLIRIEIDQKKQEI